MSRPSANPLEVREATAPNRVADRYELVRPIGKGGMGTVYEARHVVTGRRVAVKRLNAEVARNQKSMARFIQEAKATGTIGHPNIVEVLDAGEDEFGHPFLVFEYLEGVSLAQASHMQGLNAAELIDVTIELLAALQAAHEAGFVHRDIKPENIFLIREAGEQLSVKLLDFGISKDLTRNAKITHTNMIVGTPLYMSPEQALGEKLDGRSDIWAVGAILFECLTGRLPFEACHVNEVLVATATTDAPSIKSMEHSVPDELARIIDRALCRSRDQRWSNAKEMAEALIRYRVVGDGLHESRVYVRAVDDAKTTEQSLMASQPPPALRPSAVTLAAPVVRVRPRLLLWAATAVLGFAIAALVVVLWPRVSASPEPRFAAPPAVTPSGSVEAPARMTRSDRGPVSPNPSSAPNR